MSTNITLKRSSVQNKVPTTGDLALGEIAINTYDGKLFIKKNVGGTESIVDISGGGGGGSGTSTFLGLTDTPSSYTGGANQLVGVTPTEDGLGFTNEIQISEFVLSALTAPATPDADAMTMYVTASGTTPNREVSYKMKNELGQEIIISSILV